MLCRRIIRPSGFDLFFCALLHGLLFLCFCDLSSVVGVALLHSSLAEFKEGIQFVQNMLVTHRLRPIVDKTFSLAEAPQSHISVINHPNGSRGKIVLKICD
jgi:NADPH:quinone reductase-like Zn-dependent oxidoreductase